MKTPTLEELTNKTFPQLQSGDMSQAIYHDGYSYTNIDDTELKEFGKACFELGQQQKAEEIIEQITWITPKTHLNCTLQSKLPYAKNVCSCGAREFNNGIQKVLERVKELSPAPLSVEKEI